MELRHLRYFVAVAEERSFVNAARRVRVAQPALSKQIHDLERELGVALFHRLPRGVRLTRAGGTFLVHARRTLDAAERAVASTRGAAEVGGAPEPHVAAARSTAVARLHPDDAGGAAGPRLGPDAES